MQQFGLVGQRRRGAGRDRAQSRLPGARRRVRPPALTATCLQQARIGEAQYVADVRREIAAGQLFGAVRTDGLAPKSLRDDIFKMESEKRVAETIYVPDAIVVDVPKPTAEQLNAYFEANKTKFQIPEYRAFSYVLLTRRRRPAPRSRCTAEQVKQEYEARRPSSARPRSATSTRRWPTARTRPRRSSPRVNGRQVAGGRRQGSARATPTA